MPVVSDLTDTSFIDSSLVEGKSHLYAVQAVNVYGKVSDFSDTIVLFPLGENIQQSLDYHISAYPNPVKDMVNIRYPSDSKLIAVTILDLSGKVVKHIHPSGQVHAIDIQTLDPDIYLFRFEFDTGTMSRKIIKSE